MNGLKKTRLRLVLSTHFSVFGYPNETLFLVFDILRRTFALENLMPVVQSTSVSLPYCVFFLSHDFSSCIPKTYGTHSSFFVFKHFNKFLSLNQPGV